MTRIGIVALAVSAGAFVVAVAALVVAMRDSDGHEPGGIVEVSLAGRLTDEPVLTDGEFWLVGVDVQGGTMWSAYYPVVPHVVFGLQRGCRVGWDADHRFEENDGVIHTGVFTDACSGSVFSRDGARLFGPAQRDLDRFLSYPSMDGATLIVDTRVLLCANRPDDTTPCRRSFAD